jgi:hypothetical protein
MQSLSLQSFPCSHASLLSTTPLSTVATGDGCEYRQWGFVHLSPNLHNVGDCGRSGGTNPGRKAAAAGFTDGTGLASVVVVAVGAGPAGSAVAVCGVGVVVSSTALGADDGRPPLPRLIPLPPLPPPFIPPICGGGGGGTGYPLLFIPPPGYIPMSPGITPCIGNPGAPGNCPTCGLPSSPIDDAICAMSAMLLIIISCRNNGLAIPMFNAPMSPIPFTGGKPPAAGPPSASGALLVMLSIRAWMSSRGYRLGALLRMGPGGPPTRSSRLRELGFPSRSIARGPVGRSVRRDLFGGPGEGERAGAARFFAVAEAFGSA